MPRQRRTCPICLKKGLLKLSNHLTDVHHLEVDERQALLQQAKDVKGKGEEEDDNREIVSLLHDIKRMQTNLLWQIQQQQQRKQSGDPSWETLKW